MPTYVGLLRGVNVGGKNKLPMADLRALVAALGHTDVSTLIQSGNVIFTAKKAVTPATLERAITKEFDIQSRVVLRTATELAKVVDANPFTGADTSKLHVGFMVDKPTAAVVKSLDGDGFSPEQFVIKGRELYLHLPNGMGRSKLPAYLDRRLKIPTTVRNWNTVTKLLDMTR